MWSTVFDLALRQRKKSVWKNSLKVTKRKSKTTNSNLQKFIILIWCFHNLYLSLGSLENENQGEISNKITNIDYQFELSSGHGQPFGHKTRRIIYWIHDSGKLKTSNHVTKKYTCTTLFEGLRMGKIKGLGSAIRRYIFGLNAINWNRTYIYLIFYTLEPSHIFSFIFLPKPTSSPESSDPMSAHDQTSLHNTKAR